MNYKGYTGTVVYDPDDKILWGKIVGIRDGVSYEATDVEGIENAFREAVDDYLETCEKIGKKPQKSYSGQLMLRVDPTIHANAVAAAELAGKSLNQWGEEVLARAAGVSGDAKPKGKAAKGRRAA
jgi:predicted HicB family RNase H-like nuclease